MLKLGPGGPAAGREPGLGPGSKAGMELSGRAGAVLEGDSTWGEVASKGLRRGKGHLRMVGPPKLEPSSGSPGSAL